MGRRLGCTASPPLQERPGAGAAAEGMRRGENSHPAAGKRAQPFCLAAPTASALEDCRNKPHVSTMLSTLDIRKYLHEVDKRDGRTQFTMQTKASRVDEPITVPHSSASSCLQTSYKQDGFGVGAGNKFNHAALTAVMMNFSS